MNAGPERRKLIKLASTASLPPENLELAYPEHTDARRGG